MLYHMCISVHVSSAGGPEKHIFNYCPSPVALIGTPCRTAASLLRSLKKNNKESSLICKLVPFIKLS